MKRMICTMLALMIVAFTSAQQEGFWEIISKKRADSLFLEYQQTKNDTLRMKIARKLGWYYGEVNFDSGLYFNEKQRSLAKRLNLKLWEAEALDQMAWNYSQLNNYPQSLRSFSDGLKILEEPGTEKYIWQPSFFSKTGDPAIARLIVLGSIHNDLSRMYAAIGDREKELINLFKALENFEICKDTTLLSVVNLNLAESYLNINKLDSAWHFAERSLNYMDKVKFHWYKGYALTICGNICLKRGDRVLAKQYFESALNASRSLLGIYNQENIRSLPYIYTSFAELLRSTGSVDSAIICTKASLKYYQSLGDLAGENGAFSSLYTLYKSKGNRDSAYFYLQKGKMVSDSFYRAEKEKMNQFQGIVLDEQLKGQELEKQRIQTQNRSRTYAMLAGLGVFLTIGLILYRNNRQKQKANRVLETTLTNLRSAQAQLIQSEKMASLGELTAGIAHEIQNPLNFVNNFSDVNTELVDEANQEIDKGNLSEVKTILDDIKANELKINHHGKRADAIVKSMLQHSRISSGQKEPTDINALAEEYLRLAYHGLCAKDKAFDADLKTDFDKGMGMVDIIPGDIGRVLVNLLNNAFYAVNEKRKNGMNGYEPMVTLSTRKKENGIEISVKDNGNGIPKEALEKIFQPFFTTKPTGQGTGLGLSLSYDIVKTHGGELKVQTELGKGSEFILILRI